MMKKIGVVSLLLLGIAGPSRAGNLEIAPFYGVRFGGNMTEAQTGESVEVEPSGSVGATVSLALPSEREFVEFLYSYQDSQLSSDIQSKSIQVRTEVWQLGINREFPYDDDRVKPFLVGLLGFTNMDYSNNIGATTLFSLGLGGGVKYFPTKNVGLRLDLRGFVSIVDGSGAVACNGGCVVSFQGSTFLQGEIAPSLVVQF